VPALFVDRSLSERPGFEPSVGDRLATFDRKAVGTGGKSRLGALERRDLDLQVVPAALVELVLVEVLVVPIAWLDSGVALQRSLALEARERLLDPSPLVCEQLLGAV
jgi:hypothetical protein